MKQHSLLNVGSIPSDENWQSPQISCSDKPWQLYRLDYRSRAETRGYHGVLFYDEYGNVQQDDIYGSFDSSSAWVDNTVVFRGREFAKSFSILFKSKKGFEITQIKVETISETTAAECLDVIYAGLPQLKCEFYSDRWKYIKETVRRLEDGGPIRIVMLGDSIVNDSRNSNFEVLLKRMYPLAEIRVVGSVRNSTGCWYYRQDENFLSYIVDRQPDLLIIGGVSHRGDIEAVRQVAVKAKDELNCDILLMSGPGGTSGRDWRQPASTPDASLPAQVFSGDIMFKKTLCDLAKDIGVGFLDLQTYFDTYLGNSKMPFEYYHRDRHFNDRGKQILARIFEFFFAPDSPHKE